MPDSEILKKRVERRMERPDHEIPAGVRLFLRATAGSILGYDQRKQPPFTERDFSSEEMSVIRKAISNAKSDGRSYLQYGDYETDERWTKDADSILGELDLMFSDPARSVMYSLGMANFDEDGVVTDRYDFAGAPDVGTVEVLSYVPSALSDPNPRAFLNLFGNLSGLRSGMGRSVVIDTKKR